jgi:hypothetical protein
MEDDHHNSDAGKAKKKVIVQRNGDLCKSTAPNLLSAKFQKSEPVPLIIVRTKECTEIKKNICCNSVKITKDGIRIQSSSGQSGQKNPQNYDQECRPRHSLLEMIIIEVPKVQISVYELKNVTQRFGVNH